MYFGSGTASEQPPDAVASGARSGHRAYAIVFVIIVTRDGQLIN